MTLTFKTLLSDRPTIERKYHDPDKPFEALRRFDYAGYECDPATGLANDEIKKGAALLLKQNRDKPHPVAKALYVKYVLENTRIDVNESDYFITLHASMRIGRDLCFYNWADEKLASLPGCTEQMHEMNSSGAITIWPDFDHVIPDWESLMSLGFTGLRERARQYRKMHEDAGTLTSETAAIFEAIEIDYTAILAFIERLYRYALTKTHEKAPKVARCLQHLLTGAPQDIYDAMQLIYLYFTVSESVDFYQVRSLGNGLDRTLFPFYENDLKNGTFTHDEIRELLGYFMLQWQAIGNFWGQPFYLGGTEINGKTRVNALSYDIIDVYNELGLYNPKIQIKVSPATPADFLKKIYKMIIAGKNSFVFCCEPGMKKAVMGYGATEEEACDMDIRGCYETGIRASEVCTCTGYINALKPVLYVLYNGFDSTLQKQFGLATGEPDELKTFGDFYFALLRQWEYLIDMVFGVVDQYEPFLGYINPSSLYTATIEGSLQKGADAYQNGVKFNNSALLNCGLASMVDALMAVKEFVYDKKEITLRELKDALDRDWVGCEKLRAKIKNSPHKYGNADPETDRYAEALSRFFCNKVNNRKNRRGGVYKAILHSAMQFVWQGEKTPATPDGRKAGDEISKNASPAAGMDKSGVTALIRSALNLTPYLYQESFCLDVMLHSSAVSGEEGPDILHALVSAYMNGDGMSIHFNVFNAETLSDAQKHPEQYQNLQVRVCGWNVLWNNLSGKEQDSYILRAQNIKD